MKKIISCVLVCVLMLCVVANFSTARAAEPSHSMTDEEILEYTKDYPPVEAPIDPEALIAHIRKMMTCDQPLIYVYLMGNILGEYFFADPLTFLRTVAQDSAEVVDWVSKHAHFGILNHPNGWEDFPGVLFSLELTEEDSEATRNLLQAMIAATEKRYEFTREQYEFWGNSDWDDMDLTDIELSQWKSLFNYLWHERDFPRLFKIQPYTENATAADWIADEWFAIMYELFKENPYSVIQALAKQDAQMQQLVIRNLLEIDLETMFPKRWEACANRLASIRLPQSATEGEKAILAELIRITTEEYGVNVPYTGDAIALTVALLTISAGGILCLTRKMKFA